MITRYKSRFVDYIRFLLGDKDKLLFDDDELSSMIDKYRCDQRVSSTATANTNRFKVSPCSGQPVDDLTVDSDYDDDGVYLADEWANTILFDEDDPDNTGTAPDDGDTIGISYYEVDLNALMSELFWILSNSTVKLATIQSIAGLSIDTSQLAREMWRQSCKWAAEEGGCSC